MNLNMEHKYTTEILGVIYAFLALILGRLAGIIHVEDVLKTVVLSAIGAFVGFTITYILKRFAKKL